MKKEHEAEIVLDRIADQRGSNKFHGMTYEEGDVTEDEWPFINEEKR